MSDWHEDALHHKYDPLPDDGPRHRKKAKKRHVRSDHKHEYEVVAIDFHSCVIRRGVRFPYLATASRCKVCGRLGDMRMHAIEGTNPPEGMRLFEVGGFFELLDMKAIPDDMEVTS